MIQTVVERNPQIVKPEVIQEEVVPKKISRFKQERLN